MNLDTTVSKTKLLVIQLSEAPRGGYVPVESTFDYDC